VARTSGINRGENNKASDWPIVCRNCIILWQQPNYECIQGWEPNFKEFNLSSLYQMNRIVVGCLVSLSCLIVK
jgi:hypothetical protein